MVRKSLRRGVAVLVLALAGAGVWAGSQWNALQTRLASHRFQTAATDEDRTQCADALAARGDDGANRLLEFLRTGESPLRTAAASALDRRIQSLPETDPQATHLCGQLLDLFAGSDDATREALVELLPTILNRGGPFHRAKCKESIVVAFKMAPVAARLAAIRGAMDPQVGMRGEIVPFLSAPEPEVRRAALFAIGPATDAEAVIGDEELFHWLHDSDGGVRSLCREVLMSRGRTEVEIGLGQRLADPEAGERLKLLLDLRFDDDVADPEPWLERLSHDADPGVRAGSVRVMMELAAERRLPSPAWVAKLSEIDPDLTVRRIAKFYRSPVEGRAEGGLRLIGGP